jgi:hypothetical protein
MLKLYVQSCTKLAKIVDCLSTRDLAKIGKIHIVPNISTRMYFLSCEIGTKLKLRSERTKVRDWVRRGVC